MGRLLRVVMWVVILAAVLQTLIVAVFRARYRPLIDAIRAFNKHILNPVVAQHAGRAGFYAAIIHHRGRRSGKPYATPILALPMTGGFLVPLPYGAHVDWLQNVLAEGTGEIDYQGVRYTVVEPYVITWEEAVPFLAPRIQLQLGLVGVARFLKALCKAHPANMAP
jgi:deazaflavin-dependent oxidoreductase (nitroreductase family)